MLRVTHSNRLEELGASLDDALPAGDAFARPTVVVSSRLVARWLQYDLARRRGIAGGLHLPFLEPFLETAFTRDDAARAVGLRALDRPRLAALCASALAEPALIAEPAMAPVRGYLGADGGSDDDSAAVRRVQLAARVAGHLWDYALTRPDWLDAWDDGRDADVGEVDAATLAWQRRLYEAVLGPRGKVAQLAQLPGRDRGPVHWALVPRLPHARRRLRLGPPAHTAPIHVLGFSYLARAHFEALAVLAAHAEVHIALVTPCAEYWEDVPAGRKKAAAPVVRASNEETRANAPEPAAESLALVLWGAPGRDTSSMLVNATEGDVTERFVDLAPTTALAAWSGDVLRRAAPSPRAQPLPAGVTVLACPSVSRELEIVGSEIWRLLRERPELRASDVAILVAGDHERYFAQVGPVLGALHRLPFHVVEAPAAGSGRAAEAAVQLLELPMGRFTRRELLALMTHPSVLARHPQIDPADWVRWCEHLGICHGADRGDHDGTYLAGDDAFHWSQGLQRIALGGFVAGARAGVDQPVHIGGRDLLPEELTPDQHASAATFALLARSLIADARWLARRSEPLARWGEILPALIDSYLGDLDADDGRGGARGKVADDLRRLADLDLDGRPVPYREVVELARGRLGALREGRGEPLAHGVLVAPLEPMRPLPFAATFVIGLGEGEFPAIDHVSPLDLRTQRKRGDVVTRDRDRYGFLEALLAARGPVTLSYLARDEQSGEPLSPSSVIHELAEMLAPYLGCATAAEALAALTVRHPLRRWDPAYVAADRDARLVPSASPAAARERHALEVRRSLDQHLLGVDRAAPDAARLRELLADPALLPVRRALRLDLTDGVPAPADDDDAPVVISLANLRGFLDSPAQARAKVVLHLDGSDDLDGDAAEREDEPFDVDARSRAMVLREAFALVLGAGGERAGSVDDAYAKVRRHRELASQAPRGPFGAAAARHDLARLRGWQDALTARAIAGPWTRLAFGRAGLRGAELRPAIALEVEVRGRLRRVEVVGTTELLAGADLGTTLVLVHRKPDHEHRLRHAIDHLALAAAGATAGVPRQGLVLGDGGDLKVLRPWTTGEARDHLTLLARELLGDAHAYLLPLSAARTALKGKHPSVKRNDVRQSLGYGPLDRDAGLEVPPDAVAMAQRRLGPIAARMAEEDDA